MSDAIKTYPVTLKCGADELSLEELVEIKNFGDLGGAPETLDKTTMKDKMQTFIQGIDTSQAIEFTANYNKADYTSVVGKAKTHQLYALEFGVDGEDGTFYWWGEHSAWVVGTGVNAVVDMNISVVPSSEILEGTVPTDPAA